MRKYRSSHILNLDLNKQVPSPEKASAFHSIENIFGALKRSNLTLGVLQMSFHEQMFLKDQLLSSRNKKLLISWAKVAIGQIKPRTFRLIRLHQNFLANYCHFDPTSILWAVYKFVVTSLWIQVSLKSLVVTGVVELNPLMLVRSFVFQNEDKHYQILLDYASDYKWLSFISL